MTEEQIALARRAVACKAWRWMSGARAFSRARGKLQAIRVCDDIREWVARDNEFPDLEDPATLGCLLALVREAWGDDEAYTMRWHDEDGGWTVCSSDEHGAHSVAEGQTEAEALVEALEGAP